MLNSNNTFFVSFSGAIQLALNSAFGFIGSPAISALYFCF
jgi:hypothetical protein